MKSVKCNKCKHEYIICEELSKLDFPIGREQCENCGATDYVVLEDNIQFEYSKYARLDDYETQNEDLRHTLSLLKGELNELIEVYINPWLK